MRPFAVFDLDGTLVRWQLYHAIANNMAKEGFIAPPAYQEIREARMQWKRRTEPESFKKYEAVIIKVYEEALKSITTDQYQSAVAAAFDEYKEQVHTYSRDLIKTLKQRGYTLFAISGSPIEAVESVAKYYGFDDWLGTTYFQKQGRFTGEYDFPARDKDQALRQLVSKHKAAFDNSIGIGDSESDIAMLEMVEKPIAFNPTKRLFEYAKEKGWKIVVERKNVVYVLENNNGGYILS